MTPISRFAVVLIVGGAALALLYPWRDTSRPAPAMEAGHGKRLVEPRSPSFALPTASQYPAAASTDVRIFDIDGNGRLALTPEMAFKLDMLLADVPRHASPQDMQHVEEIAIAGLPQAVSQEAVSIVRAYRAYRQAEAELAPPSAAEGQAAHTMLKRVIALRRQHLGRDTADAMFGQGERQARIDMEKSRVARPVEILTPEQAPGMD